MAEVTLELDKIKDWDSFHDESSKAFGFPDFYGRNMNAWHDCLNYLDEDDGMSRFVLEPNEKLEVLLPNFMNFSENHPEISKALMEAIAFVNVNYIESNGSPKLVAVLM